MPTLSEVVAERADWRPVLRPARGAERVSWRPRDDVRADLAPRLITPVQALSHLPLIDVPPPLRDRVLNGGATPPPPAGVEPGDRYLVVEGDRLLAVAERQADGPRALRVMPRG
jgi:hypothetical protein